MASAYFDDAGKMVCCLLLLPWVAQRICRQTEAPGCDGLRILVVDDESLMRFALTQDLERAGHRVEAVSTGWEALEAVRSVPLDLMILDLRLPNVSGLDILRACRRQVPGLRVVMISAYATAEDRRAVLAEGADRFLEKPFPLAELREVVASLGPPSEGTRDF